MDIQHQKPRRIWRILLVVSLAFNLLVVGVVAGAVLRFGGGDRFSGHPSRGGLIYFREMPQAARQDIRDVAREGYHMRDAARAAQMAGVLDVLRADPFVAEDLRAIMASRTDAFRDNQVRMMDVWIGHLEAMSGVERREYADRVETAGRHPHHKIRLPRGD